VVRAEEKSERERCPYTTRIYIRGDEPSVQNIVPRSLSIHDMRADKTRKRETDRKTTARRTNPKVVPALSLSWPSWIPHPTSKTSIPTGTHPLEPTSQLPRQEIVKRISAHPRPRPPQAQRERGSAPPATPRPPQKVEYGAQTSYSNRVR
jgi:hypothetical protein